MRTLTEHRVRPEGSGRAQARRRRRARDRRTFISVEALVTVGAGDNGRGERRSRSIALPRIGEAKVEQGFRIVGRFPVPVLPWSSAGNRQRESPGTAGASISERDGRRGRRPSTARRAGTECRYRLETLGRTGNGNDNVGRTRASLRSWSRCRLRGRSPRASASMATVDSGEAGHGESASAARSADDPEVVAAAPPARRQADARQRDAEGGHVAASVSEREDRRSRRGRASRGPSVARSARDCGRCGSTAPGWKGSGPRRRGDDAAHKTLRPMRP